MNKEPLPLYILRFVFALGLFAFMGMLYWSSLLLEQDVKSVRLDLSQIKKELSALGGGFQKNLSEAPPRKRNGTSLEIAFSDSDTNLLSPDPFYTRTLPEMLGPGFVPDGIRRTSTIGKPNNLHPLSEFVDLQTWSRMCGVSLIAQKFGRYETYAPFLATHMELLHEGTEFPEYRIVLRQDVFWEPLNPAHFSDDIELAPRFLERHQVTAHDVKFFFDAVMNPHVEAGLAITLRGYFNDIEKVIVEDDFTLVVRWKARKFSGENGEEKYRMKYQAKSITGSLQAFPRFVYQYFSDGTKIVSDDEDPETYRTDSAWAQNFSRHWAFNVIVGCGAWLFDGLSEREIRFKRNPNFYDPLAALSEAIEYKFVGSIDAVWNDFKIGNSDLVLVPPDRRGELERFLGEESYLKQAQGGRKIKKLDYLARSYSYIGWNEAVPLFASRKVRQALTISIDRKRIIRQNLHGMGVETTGTFFVLSSAYDKKIKPYPYDPDRARRLLEEEGWSDSSGTGTIEKIIDGKRVPFRFELTYYVKDLQGKAVCESVTGFLKEVGIDCTPRGIDVADLSSLIESKDFDALFMSWGLGTPPEDPKQLWHSSGAKQSGSANIIGFSNSEADKLIDSLEYASDPEERVDLYRRFSRILHEEAPYTFLYTPKRTLVYREYLQNVFIPADRQDLIPGANVEEPQRDIFWIKSPS